MKTLFLQPLITEKSMSLTGEGIYQFVVPTWAEKRHIAATVADRFNVTVEDVKTARMNGKDIYFKRKPGTQTSVKKASVHLKKGDSIADFSLPVEEQAPVEAPKDAEKPAKAEEKTESKVTVRSKSGKNKV